MTGNTVCVPRHPEFEPTIGSPEGSEHTPILLLREPELQTSALVVRSLRSAPQDGASVGMTGVCVSRHPEFEPTIGSKEGSEHTLILLLREPELQTRALVVRSLRSAPQCGASVGMTGVSVSRHPSLSRPAARKRDLSVLSACFQYQLQEPERQPSALIGRSLRCAPQAGASVGMTGAGNFFARNDRGKPLCHPRNEGSRRGIVFKLIAAVQARSKTRSE